MRPTSPTFGEVGFFDVYKPIIMRTLTLIASAFLLVLPLSCKQIDLPVGSENALQNGWKLSRDGSPDSYEATVPSTVAGTLADNGVLGEDLYFADNYRQIDKSMFDTPWTYSRSFRTKVQENAHYFLEFEGLDYYADIDFNGRRLASCDTTYGVFICREYDVTSDIASRNELNVTLRRAQWGDLNIGFVDWAPRPLDESMGIVRNVSLRCTGDIKIDDLFVKPDLDVETMDRAELELSASLTNLTDKAIEVVLHGEFEDVAFDYPVSLAASEKKTVVLTTAEVPELGLRNPRVWWCRGMKEFDGMAEMYDLTLTCSLDGEISDSRSTSFGIRKIESYLDDNNARVFVLNGREVVIRGAGWADELLLRDTHESIENQILRVVHMNLNTVRFENIWGKDHTVYDLCDRYGLLALIGWSCQWEWMDYCGLPETDYGCIASEKDIKLAVRYFENQVKWMRNHPSVIAWLVGSDRTPCPELEKQYLELYSELDYRPYIGSAKNLHSELSGWTGTKMTGPYDYVGPEYWYIDTMEGGAFSFNTETGIGVNLPVEESIRKMVPADSLWPLTKSWDAHCTSSGSSMSTMTGIVEPVNASFGRPATLQEFIRRAQALDYDSTRAMYEAFRNNIPVSTGVVHWMLNSAWPSMYWQLYDFFQVPTAAYYAARKSNEAVHASFNYKDNCVYVLNETGASADCKLEVTVFDARSGLLDRKEMNLTSESRKPFRAYELTLRGTQDLFLNLRLTVDGETRDNFYCLPALANNYLWDQGLWFKTPIDPYANLRFVSCMPKAEVEFNYELNPGDREAVVTLTNKSEFISYQNVLKLVNSEGEIIVPSYWEDNYFAVLPGETKVVVCRVPEVDYLKTARVIRSSWNDSSDIFPVSLGEPEVFETGLGDLSGIKRLADGNFVLADNGGYVVVCDSIGTILAKHCVNPDSTYVDMESVAVDYSTGDIYFVDERTSNACRWDGKESFEIVANVDIPGRERNFGPEAIEFVEDTLYIGNQARPSRLFKYSLKSGEVQSRDLKFAETLSDFCFEPNTNTFWVSDSFGRMLYVCDRSLNVLKGYELPYIAKQEGLWVDWKHGYIWLACDASGRIYKTKMNFQ